MGQQTNIEWCDSTVNPTMGCDGCELHVGDPTEDTCYTGFQHDVLGRAGRKGWAGPTFKDVTLYPGRMVKAALWSDLRGVDRPAKPWLNGRPRHIFVSDMSDALSRVVPFEYLKREIIDVVASSLGQRHVWIWLSKRPARMAEFDAWLAAQGVAWPVNLWAMTSLTTQATVVPRVRELRKVRAAVRGLSCEPMLGPLDLREALAWRRLCDGHAAWHCDEGCPYEQLLHWVICGGESGHNARPMHPEWARGLRDQTGAAKVAFFHKQWGDWQPYHQGNAYVDGYSDMRVLKNGAGATGWPCYRVGKVRAGRKLDGHVHNEFPVLTHA